ncbi:MAG TPA: selenocysteine-specific translation elongation factor [Longimicrobiales bacterium]
MRSLVLGTAGHIDHGKTALVRALTGIDTDRLPDEKRRGITIDLGFARLPLTDGGVLSIVDVPGHEAFVRNMLAGATGIDLVLLVVAADEGVMPQTREHLAILQLLGIRRGVVALTKCDLVEPDWLELVRDELRELLGDTALADAPVIDVSARTGAGLDSLRAALETAAADVPARSEGDLFRMPIDRIFTVRGTGTVVTGTVWSGTLTRDAQVGVLPAGMTARVRALQQHGRDCDAVAAGARAAVALTGIDRDALERGDALLTGAGWSAAGILTVQLRVVEDSWTQIRPRQRVRVHLGTAEVLGRVGLLTAPLEPGASDVAQLRLESPIVARAGDHLVLRSYSPVHTIAGGVVLEPAAPKRKRLPAETRTALDRVAQSFERIRVAASVADAADVITDVATIVGPVGLERGRMPILTGLTPALADAAVHAAARLTVAGDRIVRSDLLEDTGRRIVETVAAHHRIAPMLDGMEREAVRDALAGGPLFDAAVDRLIAEGRLVAAGNALALPEHSATPSAEARRAIDRLAELFRSAGAQPPDVAELPPDLGGRPDLPLLIRFLERDGTLVRLSATRLISSTAVAECVAALRGQLSAGQPLTVGDFKEVLNLTRKHLIPLLEHLDRTGITRRDGELRRLAPL